MKRTILILALVSLVGLGGQAFAELCTTDNVPAASLLIPSFVVDVTPEACANRTGLTTLFSINNASAAPQIAHVTLWTDQTVPVLDFDVYLTGYDVQTINLRNIFCDGELPQTGFGVSPNGSCSDPGVAFPSCNNSPTPGGGPNYTNPFSGALIQLLQEWFTGKPSSALATCAGSGQTGDIAIGYITIDNTTDCSLSFPSDPDYYTSGLLGFNNVLWGDYFFQDQANAFAQGFNAVHIEADQQAFVPGDHTFYGRYNGASAADAREPLGTTYATRFARGGVFDGTNLHIWREADGSSASYSCAADGPGWWPLDLANQTGKGAVIAWNESETVCEIVPDPGPSNPLPDDEIAVFIPNEVNFCPVGESTNGFCLLEVCDFNFGWIYLNLQASASAYGDNITQNHVATIMAASGLYSVGLDAVSLDSACTGDAIVVNP
jgi:hypothetical protein